MPVEPTPADVARTLAELGEIGSRSRRAATSAFVRRPLLLWGLAWLAGFAALDLLPWPLAVPLGVAFALAAALGSRLWQAADAVSGWEARLRWCWAAILGVSPLLVLVVSPVPATRAALLLGALWGLALLLYAVACGDLPLGAVGAVIVVAAAVTRLVDVHPLLLFGLVGGLAQAGLGLSRMRAVR